MTSWKKICLLELTVCFDTLFKEAAERKQPVYLVKEAAERKQPVYLVKEAAERKQPVYLELVTDLKKASYRTKLITIKVGSQGSLNPDGFFFN